MNLKFWQRKKSETIQKRWEIRQAAPTSVHSSYPNTGNSFDSGAKYMDGLRLLNAASGLKLNHEKVLKQARIAYHDSSMAKSIVDRYAMLGIGSGLFLEAAPQAEFLGRSPEELAEWSYDVQRRFHLWARDKNSDITEELTFYQLQNFYMRSQQRDGEYFCRMHYKDGEVKYGTFDPTQLEEGVEGQTRFDCGVHRNQYGAIDKYRIRVSDQKVVIFPKYTSNGKILIIHGFMPDYSGQVRGISQIAHILQECKLLSDYQIFELIKAGLHASINLWVKPSKDAPATNIFDGMATNAGPMAEYSGDDIPAEPDPNTDPLTYKRMDEAISFGGGMSVFNLNGGEELKSFDPSSPNEAFSAFNKAIEDVVYPSVNIPSEIGRMSFNSNYSASQAAILIFWDVLKVWRDEMASDLLNPVYDAWLDNEIARGRIKCPGWSDPFLRKAWGYCEWTGKGRPHIDPVKYASGEKLKIELGATTQERIARETNGSNAALNRAKLRKELDDMPNIPWQKDQKDRE
jgi:lambda family phage portal protein